MKFQKRATEGSETGSKLSTPRTSSFMLSANFKGKAPEELPLLPGGVYLRREQRVRDLISERSEDKPNKISPPLLLPALKVYLQAKAKGKNEMSPALRMVRIKLA